MAKHATNGKRHCFSIEVQKALISRETDQTNLARTMTKRGYRVSKQFIGAIANGDRRVPAEQLRRMCEVLQLDEAERHKLHLAAALDYGFELGSL